MGKKRINLNPVFRIINNLEMPGEPCLTFEQRLCALDTAKQILLYQKAIREKADNIEAEKAKRIERARAAREAFVLYWGDDTKKS